MWQNFELFVGITILMWFVASGAAFSGKRIQLVMAISLLGIVSLGVFIALLWFDLDRPPLRTLGETRLWYALFLALSGVVLYQRWRIKLMLFYALGMAILFLMLNYLNPATYSKTLMPALQSPWFVPHVIVYMVAYALLGLSSILGVLGLYAQRKNKIEVDYGVKAENVVNLGFSFLSLGLIFVALWAKEAWGHYWTWDPKETWAFLTWAVYLVYIHFRLSKQLNQQRTFTTLVLAFVVLLIRWFGINYLPATNNSVHVFSS